jgi:4-hydroxy-2-oxoheptanedioate aldolase
MREIWINPLGYGPVLLRKLAAAGWSHFMVDQEHNFLTDEDLLHALAHIKAAGAAAIVRPPDSSARALRRAIEAGARRFLIPGVDDPRTLAVLNEAARDAGADIELCPLVESVRGIGNISEMAQLPYVKSVHLGPYDLSRELKLTDWRDWTLQKPHLEAALGAIRSAGLRAGCYVLPEWLDTIPLPMLDIVSVGLHELATPDRGGLRTLVAK